MKNYLNVFFVCLLLSSCILEQGKISIRAPHIDKTISVANVQLINNQFVISGKNLDNVTTIKIKNASTEIDLAVESKNSGTLIANSLSHLTLAATKVFDLILSSAEASATFTIDLGQWTVDNNNIYRPAGSKVGIGTTTPLYPLHIQDAQEDPLSAVVSGKFIQQPTFTSTTTNYSYGVSTDNYPTISNGSAITGGAIGLQSNAVLTGTSDGTLESLFGIRSSVGINTGATTTVANSYGIWSRPLHYGGTTTNSYNLFLASPGTGGTVTNEYGIFQQSPTAKNIFSGRVGINTTNPGGLFDINGTKTGTGTLAGTTVITGVGTQFLSEVSVGDIIFIPSTGDERVVKTITSNTSLTIDPAFNVDPAGGTFTLKKRVGLGSGNAAIGGNLNTQIISSAGLFPGIVPKLEITTGTNTWQPYSELMVMRHTGSSATAVSRQLGFLFKMSDEASVSQSNKTGGMIYESAQTYANNPYLSLVTQNARRLTIDFNGLVGIGTTTPGYKLDVQGGDINASGSVRASGVALTSDRRWKRNITPLTDSVDKLKKLNGVSYVWAVDEYPEKQFSDRKQVGVIAQDVQAVFPELVSTDKDGYLSVNYPALVAPLIEGFKAQQKQIEANNRTLASLKNENAQMKTEVEELKAAVCELQPKLKACKK